MKDLTIVGNGTSHCSEELQFFDTSDVEELGSFRLIDTKGFEENVEDSTTLFEKVLKGQYPDGFNFVKQKFEDLPKEEQEGLILTASMREAGAVVFCITAGSVQEMNPEFFDSIKERIAAIAHLKHNSIILITKMDNVFPGIKENPHDITLKNHNGDLTLEDFLANAKEACGLNRVLYVANYTDETLRSFQMDSMAFAAMNEIKNCCESRRTIASRKDEGTKYNEILKKRKDERMMIAKRITDKQETKRRAEIIRQKRQAQTKTFGFIITLLLAWNLRTSVPAEDQTNIFDVPVKLSTEMFGDLKPIDDGSIKSKENISGASLGQPKEIFGE